MSLESLKEMILETNFPIWTIIIVIIGQFMAFYGGYVLLKKTVETLKIEVEKALIVLIDVPTMKHDILNIKQDLKLNTAKDKDADEKREELRKELTVSMDRHVDKLHNKLASADQRIGGVAQGLIKVETKLEIMESKNK